MEGLLVLFGLIVVVTPLMAIVALVKIGSLGTRVGLLESELDRLRRDAVAVPPPTAGAARPEPEQAFDPWSEPATSEDSPAQAPTQSVQGVAATVSAAASMPALEPAPEPPSTPSPEPPSDAWSVPATGPTLFETAGRLIRHWFTQGNVPVKVGMLVLFVGVAGLLKYVAEQGWMRFPIELRLAGIALAALAGLVLGWRQREQRRSFALSVQGGAIGVLLMTVFAAFRLYDLLPAGAALALCVVLVAGSGVLAVAQNAMALAVLGILAGFLAPVLLSSGGGNHVALFSWYAVLNLAILAIAWLRPWRVLNLLGFVFTFGIGTAWGVLVYRPEQLASTLPFLIAFFVFYLLIPILYARRRGAARRDVVDGCLVFGNPLVSFVLLAGLLDGARWPLAFSALAVAAVHALLAWGLMARERYRPLTQSYAVLAVGFATLAVPLALSAQVTASIFALEGAALVWLGLRQDQRLPLWGGTALQVLAAAGWWIGLDMGGPGTVAIANATFLGGLLLAVAGFASAFCHLRHGNGRAALAFYLWGLFWWWAMAATEITWWLSYASRPDAWLAFIALTAGLAALALRWRHTQAVAWTVVAAVAAALPVALDQAQAHGHPFAHYGLWAWLAFTSLGACALRSLRHQPGAAPGWAHGLWWLVWPLVLNLWLERTVREAGLAEGWRLAAAALPMLLVAALLRWREYVVAWPFGDRFAQWRGWFLVLWLAISALLWFVLVGNAGPATPLPWIPLLNPLELALLASLGLVAALFWHPAMSDRLRAIRVPVLSIMAFATVSAITLRGVHHLGGAPWGEDIFRTPLAQASLSLVWSVLGVVGWTWGSRRGQRVVWLAGAVLMAVVLAKLVLIDRQHLGNLLGIASFIGYGLLCTAVGYFAPAPPRERGDNDEETAA